MPAEVAYLDSSALVKLVVREPESAALRRFLRRHPVHASSALATTEVLRAVRRADPSAMPAAHDALGRLVILDLTEDLLREAGLLNPASLRTPDAIHLSAARALGSDLALVVTYDERRATAGALLGFAVEAPA